MGLVKMYRVTGNEKYLKLAKYFLDLCGLKGVMRKEYSQTNKPVIMQDEAVGHAVRAAYMYSGMADVAAIMGDKSYLNAIDKIWDNVVEKKYYITGGIGAKINGEAFDVNYKLPNREAYCETCAAIANVYWNWRMFLLHGEAKYYDVIERTLYNGLISGISLSGDHFFYPNPLESNGKSAVAGRDVVRSEWFGCACCPSNLCRFTASVPGYIYAHHGDSLYVNLYIQGTGNIDMNNGEVVLTQTTEMPWKGGVSIRVDKNTESEFCMMLRLPGWANDGSACLWWLNGINHGTSVKANVMKTIELDGKEQTVIAWDLSASGLYDTFNVDYPNICQGQTIFGVTSTADDGSCEIYDIDFVEDVDAYINTTGISNITNSKSKGNIYDLAGRKVKNLNAKGIYIVDGKKQVVK